VKEPLFFAKKFQSVIITPMSEVNHEFKTAIALTKMSDENNLS
jgi:hypothetical protein